MLFKQTRVKCSFSLQALTNQLTDKELAQGRLYPPLADIQKVSINIAIKVSNNLYLIIQILMAFSYVSNTFIREKFETLGCKEEILGHRYSSYQNITNIIWGFFFFAFSSVYTYAYICTFSCAYFYDWFSLYFFSIL